MNSSFLYHAWGFTALNVQESNTKVIQLYKTIVVDLVWPDYMCGFRDEEYFKLRLYALHDCRITRNVG